MLAVIAAVLFFIAAIIELVQNAAGQLPDILMLIAAGLLALHIGGFGGRFDFRRFDVLAMVAALLSLIALILEFTTHPAPIDILLTTVALLLASLYLAGVGPRALRV